MALPSLFHEIIKPHEARTHGTAQRLGTADLRIVAELGASLPHLKLAPLAKELATFTLGAGVEEAGQYPTSTPIDRMFGVLRSSSGVPIQLILTANPGGAVDDKPQSSKFWLGEIKAAQKRDKAGSAAPTKCCSAIATIATWTTAPTPSGAPTFCGPTAKP
jgi:hypothetical protein